MKNIFISSTFIDMQAERDLVQERVLPALRDEARKYGDNVGVIDLRWGVDTSTLETEEGAAKVLQVCLDEIDRSHPYMLIFLGERYGTMMREDQIEKSVRGREDKYTTNDYVKSITALEVEYGALSEKYGELNHCVVCFREPVVHMLDGAEKDLYAEHTEEGKRKLEALKERIKRDLGDDDRLITYSCAWDKSARQLVDFTSNGQPLENVLTNCFVEMFRDDWKEYESLSWQDKEQLVFRALMESKLRSFVGREALLEEYYQSVVNGTCPIILQGEVGSGKTAIMCKLVERLQKEGKNVFAFFAGAGSMSTNAEFLVKQMVYYMENLLGVEEHFGKKEEEMDETDDVTEKLLRAGEKRVQYDDWMEQLIELCLRFPEGEKVYFCIDAMDQLFRDEHVEKLDFFVRGKNTQVVAFCTDEFELPMEVKVKREVKQISALSEEDAKMVAEGILASYSRNVYAAIEEEILNKKSIGNPLYISLLIQRLNMMDTEELRKAMNEEEIVALGTGIIREMPENTEEAIVAVIRNGIEKISESEELLYEVLEYLAVSRNGLRMSDLQGIFAAKGRMLPVLDFTLLMKYLDSFFYVHGDDRIDFTHKVIRQGLLKVLTDREAKEETIKEYLKTLDVLDGLLMREGMYYARIRRDEEFAKKLIGLAYNQESEELLKAIKVEAVTDEGEFYCRLIEKETEEGSVICNFFGRSLVSLFDFIREEQEAQLKIANAEMLYREKIFEKNGSKDNMINLAAYYMTTGDMYVLMLRAKQIKQAEELYEKALKYFKIIYEKQGNFGAWKYIMIVYQKLSKVYSFLRLKEKMQECAKVVIKELGQSQNLWRMQENAIDLYAVMISSLVESGYVKEALAYGEEELQFCRFMYEKYGDEKNSINLVKSYYHLVEILFMLNRSQEAMLYSEKLIEIAECCYEQVKSIRCFWKLIGCYAFVGEKYYGLGNRKEGLLLLEKAMKGYKDIYERWKCREYLKDVWSCSGLLRKYYLDEGQTEKVLSHCEYVLDGFEEIMKKNENEEVLRELIRSYVDKGKALRILGRLEEALICFEKSLTVAEKLWKEYKTEVNGYQLYISGSIYERGNEVKKDLKKAKEYLERAAKVGDVEAKFYLATLYLKGKGVKRDVQKAFVLYKESAEHDDVVAQYILGMLYMKGKGVHKDLKQAIKWYERAAEQGDIEAQFTLGALYVRGKGVERNLELARELFSKAAKGGHPKAMRMLKILE